MSSPTLEDYKKIKEQRSEHIRESWVRAMEVRITRDMLETCYTTEGVNSQQHCSELAQKYLGMLKDHKAQGYKVLDFES